MESTFLENLPVPAIYAGVTLLMLAACEAGYFSGGRAQTRRDKDAPTSIGPMVGGLLGLLAFLLAFTFSMAAAQYNLRKTNVLDEANAIGTAFLRTDLLNAEASDEVRNLLREYVDVRLEATRGGDLDLAIERSMVIHRQLWDGVVAEALAGPTSNTSLVIQSINNLIDMHESRVTGALRDRIPDSVWIALMIISLLTMMTLGVQAGLTGRRRLIAIVPLSLAFAALVVLVVDLDRPQQGLIKIGQSAMIDLQRSMAEP